MAYVLGDKRMDKAQYLEFIEQNCEEAFKSYKTGRTLAITGWVLFGVGAYVTLSGSSMFWASNILYWTDQFEDYPLVMSLAGGGVAAAGLTIVAASIPCVVIGEIKLHTSHKVYNASCAKPAPTASLQFGIQSSQNGIGLAMKF